MVLNNGKIFSWGSNNVGQLGHGETFETLNEPKQVLTLKHQVVVQAACGDLHTAAITDAGDNIWTWGRGLEGQLGHGSLGEMPVQATIYRFARTCGHAFCSTRLQSISHCYIFNRWHCI